MLLALWAAPPAGAASCPGANPCPYSSDTLLDRPADNTVRLPEGVGVDPTNGEAVVTDTLDDRVTAFRPTNGSVDGSPIDSFGSGQTFDTPTNVAVDAHGNRYVLDVFGDRIDVLSPSGTLLLTFGDTGDPLGAAMGLALDGSSHVYVADSGDNRIVRYTVTIASETGTSGNSASEDYTFNDAGMGSTLFDPTGIAVDGSNVYVANSFGRRVDYYIAGSNGATLQASWDGSDGSNPQFNSPVGIGVDGQAGRLFVSDEGGTVFEYQINGSGSTATLSYVTRFGGDLNHTVLTPLLGSEGVAVDAVNHRVFVADRIGSQVAQVTYSPTSSTVTLDQLIGHPGPGQLISPVGLAIDGQNHLFEADSQGARVQELNTDGSSRALWTLTTSSDFGTYPFYPTGLAVTSDAGTLFVTDGNPYGTGGGGVLLRYTISNGQLSAPTALTAPSGSSRTNLVGVAVDGAGHAFVADESNSRILVYDSAGNYLFSFSTGSSGNEPVGVASGGSGTVYVTELLGSAHVQRYDVDFAAKTAALDSGFQTSSSTIGEPFGVTFDAPSGHLYVSDIGDSTVEELDQTGAQLAKWGGSAAGGGPGYLHTPGGVATDSSGSLYVADTGFQVIHQFAFGGSSSAYVNPCPAGSGAPQPAGASSYPPAANLPGRLDPSFGWSGTAANGGGQQTGSGFTFQTHFGGSARPFAIVQQPNGELVEAGCSKAGEAFGLTRYYQSNGGGPDFSLNFEPSVGSGHASAGGVAIDTSQGDVRPIAAGAVNDGTAFGAVRYLPSETADTSWGGGLALASFPGHSALAVTGALLDAGKLVVVGYGKNDSTGQDDWLLARFSSTGALDPSFGSGGMVTTSWGDGGQAQSIRVDGSDYLVAGTGDTGRFSLAKYHISGGSLDTGFDQDGKVTTVAGNLPDAERGLAFDPIDNDIVVAGATDSGTKLAIARYHDDGQLVWVHNLDTGSLNTQLTTGVQSAGVVVRPDGEAVIAGSGNPNDPTSNQILVGAFDESGNQDFVTESSIGANAIAHDILLDATQDAAGRVVVAGDTEYPRGSDKGFFVARFVAGALPTATAKPQIAGTTTKGQQLTTTSGNWNGCGPGLCTYHYQWQRCTSSCAPISDAADSSAYTLREADVGDTIEVCVTAANETGTATGASCSDAVGPVNGLAPKVTTGTATASPDRTQLTLTGSIDPQQEPTTYYFQYSTDSKLNGAHPTSDPTYFGEAPQAEPGADYPSSTAGGVTTAISNLHPSAQYYYRLVAVNKSGTSLGDIFALPYVVTNGQPSPSAFSDHLNVAGSVNPGTLPTASYFEYSTNSDMSNAGAIDRYGAAGMQSFDGDTLAHPVGTTFPPAWSAGGSDNLDPGTQYYYRVVAQNAAGTTKGDPQSVTTASNPPPPYTVQGIQVTQGVQTDIQEPGAATATEPGVPFAHPATPYSGVKLAAGGKTIVRVFVHNDGGPFPHVLLYGYGDSGAPLPGSPKSPENTDGDLSADPPETKVDNSDGSFDFVLPDGWSTGTVKLVAVAVPSELSSAAACTTCSAQDALEVGGIGFTQLSSVHMRFVALKEAGDNFPPPPWDTLNTAEQFLPEPLKQDFIVDPQPYDGTLNGRYVAQIDISDLQDNGILKRTCDFWVLNCHLTVQQYDANQDAEAVASNRVDQWDRNNATPAADVTIGISKRDFGIATVYPPIFTLGANRPTIVVSATNRPLTGMAHELAHTFGLYHSFTDPSCLSSTDKASAIGYVLSPGNTRGIDYGDNLDRLKTQPDGAFDVVGSRSTRLYDFMSYCGNGDEPDLSTKLLTPDWPSPGDQWVSPVQWNRMIDQLAANRYLAPRGRVEASAAAAHGPALEVTGFVAADGTHLDTVAPATPGVGPEGTASGYHVIGRNARGAEVASAPVLAVAAHAEHLGGLLMLDSALPAKGVSSIQITDPSGKVVATRTRPRRRPRVRILAPKRAGRNVVLRWRARGARKLIVTVAYSADGGRHWVQLFLGPNRGKLVVSARALSLGGRARLRVTANDGFNQVAVVSRHLRPRR